jgi:hypothetical protein
VTILSEGEPADAVSRQQLRLDRQARVGILRNLHEPPRLPPRKASLTGKWLDMRSRRRLQRDGVEAPALPASGPGREAGPAGPDAVIVTGAATADPVAARLRRSLRDLTDEADTTQAVSRQSDGTDAGDVGGQADEMRAAVLHPPRRRTGLFAGLALALAGALVAIRLSGWI